MFSGLSAFPLTPLREDKLDEASFTQLIARLVEGGVDSIGALGSTGNYAYLSRAERARVSTLAVEHAAGIPVIVGIGALRLSDVLHLAEDAQKAGVKGVLLAPVSYQPLNSDEVYELFHIVNNALSVPLCVYDNPRTTRFAFDDVLLGEIAQLSNVRSIKIPAVSLDVAEATKRVEALRAVIPAHVGIGVSGDFSATAGLNAGCDTWYSVIGGLFPKTAVEITRAAQRGDQQETARLMHKLDAMWDLLIQYGGVRVMAAAAEMLDLAESPCLPLPLQSLSGVQRDNLRQILTSLNLS